MLCGAEELLIPQPELVKAAFPVLAGHPPIIKGAQRRTVSPCALAIYGLDSKVHATSVRSSLSTTRPRATGSRSASETAAPGDVGRQPRGLMWEPRALDTLEQLAEYMPSAARDALEAMERMAWTGFNYGRLTPKRILWYLPTRSSASSTSTMAAR